MITETTLLERLVDEAARRGTVERQRDDALATMERAAESFRETSEALSKERRQNADLKRSLDVSETARGRAFDALADLSAAAINFRHGEAHRKNVGTAARERYSLALEKAIEAARAVYEEEIPF